MSETPEESCQSSGTSKRPPPEPIGPRWYPFLNWCAAKGFTRQHAYRLIDEGKLVTVMSGRCRYVTEEEDRRFSEACRSAAEAPRRRYGRAAKGEAA